MNLTALAWRVVPRLPPPLARLCFSLAADAAWLRRGKPVRQLEANLRRVMPGATEPALRRVSRQGMRRYLRYYCEACQLAGWSEAQVDALVEFEFEVEAGVGAGSGAAAEAGPEVEAEAGSGAAAGAGSEAGAEAEAGAGSGAEAGAGRGSVLGWVEGREDLVLGQARQAVLALAHMGNWDLAGAWAARNLGPVITVAERLKPEAVFQDFLRMRQAIGLRIIPLEAGLPVFRQLLEAVGQTETWLAPLLADRDLGRSGVEVDFFGEKALVAAGPAALALATGQPLVPVAMWRRERRGRPARGYVLHFGQPVAVPQGMSKQAQIHAITQAWVAALEAHIRRHPADWHMLQKVFLADLEPGKLESVRGRGGGGAVAPAGSAAADQPRAGGSA